MLVCGSMAKPPNFPKEALNPQAGPKGPMILPAYRGSLIPVGTINLNALVNSLSFNPNT